VDAMLTGLPDPDRIDLLLGFAHRVWQGDYGEGTQVELAPFKSRFMPSARRSNWKDCPTPPIVARASTGSASNDKSKRTAAKIHQPYTKSPSQPP
jgi:hypothetical protein